MSTLSQLDWLWRADLAGVAVGFLVALVAYGWIRAGAGPDSAAVDPGERPHLGRDAAMVSMGLGLFAVGIGVAIRFGIVGLVPFGISVALIMVAGGPSRAARRDDAMGRRVAILADVGLTTTLLGGVLILLNIAVFRYGGRPFDLTRDESFSLSPLSRNELQGLGRPLRMTLVQGRANRSTRRRERLRRLVDQYRAANPSRVAIEEMDAFQPSQSAALEALVARVPELAVVPGDALVLEYGDDADRTHAVASVGDMFRDNGRGGSSGSSGLSFLGEDAITSTIVRLRDGKRSRIGFTAGHDEPGLAESDPRLGGLGAWRSRLTSVGIDAVDLDLNREDVPQDIGLVVIVGPRTRFQDRELKRLEDYGGRGGPILVLSHAPAAGGIDRLLTLHNLVVGTGQVVDPERNLDGMPTMVVSAPLRKGEGPLVDALQGESILVPAAAPIRNLATPSKPGSPRGEAPNPAIVVAPFLRTGPRAWVETDPNRPPAFDAAQDTAGPLILGALASERPGVVGSGLGRPRLLLISSSSIAGNPEFSSMTANADLLMNAVAWLRGRPDSLGLAPKIHRSVVFDAGPGLRTRLHLVPTVLAATLILGFGLMTYLARRN